MAPRPPLSTLVPKTYYRSLGPLLDRPTLASAPNWPAIFGRNAPRELEIGFGNGEFLDRSSQAAPERDFIGLEIAWSSVKRALRRLANPPRANARVAILPAYSGLALLFKSQSLSVIRVLFPVPWPRESHAGKRLLSTAFLNLVADRLTDQGLFQLVTDDQTLADWTLAEAQKSALSLTITKEPAGLNTKYERKWRDQGLNSFFHFTGRPKGFSQLIAPSLTSMRPTFLDHFDPLNYRPQGLTGPLTVIFGDLNYDVARREGLLFTKVVEEGFVQEFFIRVSPLPDGRYKLSPAILGEALPTAGVQMALALAALKAPHD
ncbi:MAG: hypothetical protein LBI10_01870 [Deltaproteobacteria bacterium]|nr:hypothetical protein [Deltaproteobacteria bacterium]